MRQRIAFRYIYYESIRGIDIDREWIYNVPIVAVMVGDTVIWEMSASVAHRRQESNDEMQILQYRL